MEQSEEPVYDAELYATLVQAGLPDPEARRIAATQHAKLEAVKLTSQAQPPTKSPPESALSSPDSSPRRALASVFGQQQAAPLPGRGPRLLTPHGHLHPNVTYERGNRFVDYGNITFNSLDAVVPPKQLPKGFKANKLPKFSGDVWQLNAWLHDVVWDLKMAGVDPECWSYCVHRSLEEPLKTWSLQSIDKLSTWEDYIAALRAEVYPANYYEQLMARLTNLRQRGSMSVRTLANKFINIVRQMGDKEPNESMKKYMFLLALRDDLRNEIRMFQFQNFQEVVDTATRAETMMRQAEDYRKAHRGGQQASLRTMDQQQQGSSRGAPGASATPHRGVQPRGQPRPEVQPATYMDALASMPPRNTSPGQAFAAMPANRVNPPALTPEERTRCDKQGLCYRCRQPGHLATQCQKYARNGPGTSRPMRNGWNDRRQQGGASRR